MHKDLARHVDALNKQHEQCLRFLDKVSGVLDQCIKAGLPAELHKDAYDKENNQHPLMDWTYPRWNEYKFKWSMMNWQYIGGRRSSGNGYGSLDVTITPGRKTMWMTYYKGEQFSLECDDMPAAVEAFVKKHQHELELR